MASRHAWNICYRQPDTISDRKTHVPIEIEAHRNVEVIMNCKKGLFDTFCHRKHIFTKGIGFTSCKKSYFFSGVVYGQRRKYFDDVCTQIIGLKTF